LLREVAAALADPHSSGVAILGADGVGKTLLAHSAAEAFDVPSTRVHRVVATATERASRSAHSVPC
jgi:MoxR-like ATPase